MGKKGKVGSQISIVGQNVNQIQKKSNKGKGSEVRKNSTKNIRAIINKLLSKPFSEWNKEDNTIMQCIVDSIHNAQYGGSKFGDYNPICVTISADGHVIISKNNGVPGPKARRMAKKIFGDKVKFVRGGKNSNYKDPVTGKTETDKKKIKEKGLNHAEARGIQYMRDNDIEIKDAKQATALNSCDKCIKKQNKHKVDNITNPRDQNGNVYNDTNKRSYVDGLWILEEGD